MTTKVRHFRCSKVLVMCGSLTEDSCTKKAGSTSNSITYPHSRAAFTLVFFVTRSSYGLAYTPPTRALLKTGSGDPQDGNTSVPSLLSLPFSGFADKTSLADRGLSLGYGLLYRRERLRNAAVWGVLRNDCIIWHWGVQVTNAVSGPLRTSLGRATEGWCRCDKPRSHRICILQSSDVIQF